MKRAFNYTAVGAVAFAIAFFSLRPLAAGGAGPATPLLAYVKHAVAYAALSLALFVALREEENGMTHAFVLAASYGIAIEALQVPLSFRSGSMLDAGVNAIGAAIIFLAPVRQLAGHVANLPERLGRNI